MTAPVSLGQGFNSVSGAGMDTAMIIDASSSVGGQSVASLTVCQSLLDLTTALDVSQSLSIGYMGITTDAKLDLIRKTNFSTNNLAVVIYARNFKEQDTATAYHLDAPYSDAASFFLSYGDSFVSSMTTGGEYCAVYTFYSESQEEQSSISASLQVQGIVSGVDLNSTTEASLATALSSSVTKYSFNYSISGLANPQPPGPSDCLVFAQTFLSFTMDLPVIFDFSTTGYESIAGVGSDFRAIATNRNLLVGDGVISGLAEKLLDLNQLLDRIVYIKELYKFYNNFSDPKLDDLQQEAKTDLANLHALYFTVYNLPKAPIPDMTSPTYDPNHYDNPPSLTLGLPVFTYTLSLEGGQHAPGHPQMKDETFDDSGPWTGADRKSYYLYPGITINSMILRQSQISRMELGCDALIGRFTTIYKDSCNAKMMASHPVDSSSPTTSALNFNGSWVASISYTITTWNSGFQGLAITLANGSQLVFDSSRSIPSGSTTYNYPLSGGSYLDKNQFVLAWTGHTGDDWDCLCDLSWWVMQLQPASYFKSGVSCFRRGTVKVPVKQRPVN